MKKLLIDFGIDETYTRPVKKEKDFNHVKDNIPLIKHYNYMADILFLPTTKTGFKYCLVVVDLATNEFDIEPIKNKEPETILKAFKTMFKRPFIKKPYASVRTDDGTEFKGVFNKWLYDENIFHSVGKSGRHKQIANVESLNRQLGRLFNGYMNKKEEETGKVYKEWTNIVPQIREKLNKIRKITYKDTPYTHKYPVPNIRPLNKYKVGDIVYVKLDKPQNALMENQPTEKFREGDYRFDRTPRKILKIFYYTGKNIYRYLVTGIPNVSYSEAELRPATEKEEEFKVKQIIDKKKVGNKIYYLVWWAGYKKGESTWETKKKLMEDVPQKVKEYEDSLVE
jgi:hypothetical protein